MLTLESQERNLWWKSWGQLLKLPSTSTEAEIGTDWGNCCSGVLLLEEHSFVCNIYHLALVQSFSRSFESAKYILALYFPSKSYRTWKGMKGALKRLVLVSFRSDCWYTGLFTFKVHKAVNLRLGFFSLHMGYLSTILLKEKK